ncbi:hypothetical protein VNO77_34751 [Canavalia gladiata]|uniref:Uncharacterized protein n=1 Tax=Canavalia gladiata TaxID=3824 RepID=A0AAN9PXF1_CANGL
MTGPVSGEASALTIALPKAVLGVRRHLYFGFFGESIWLTCVCVVCGGLAAFDREFYLKLGVLPLTLVLSP